MNQKDLYPPKASISAKAHINSLAHYQEIYKESISNNSRFWEEKARELLYWQHDFQMASDCDFEEGMISWFLGGKLNACENCVDRHVQDKGNQIAIIWESDEPGETKQISYKELQRKVSQLANVLRHNGIQKGDRVAIYMPMIPEAAYAMLACTRIGAVHSVVFAGFSAEALRDRINDSKCKAVITADEGLRGKKIIQLKRTVDEAVMACPTVEHIFVARRTGNKVPFFPPRDIWLDEAMAAERPYCPV